MLNKLKKEDKMYFTHLIELSSGNGKYSDFLDNRRYLLWIKLANYYNIEYELVERIVDASKKVIWFGSIRKKDNCVSIYHGKCRNNVTHQQVLGALFGIGLNNNTIGDILVDNNNFYFTNLTRLNTFVENNLLLVGKQRVELEKIEYLEWHKDKFIILTLTVSSNRLDNIVSKLSNSSRSNSQSIIKNNGVLVNYEIVNKYEMSVNCDDIISIYHVGKFKIGKIVGNTKKNKLILEVLKYN